MNRLISVAFSLAFKMVSEIDWQSLNQPLAGLLGLTVPHFNAMESAIFAGLNFNVGITEEKFKSKVDELDKVCLPLYQESLEKTVISTRVS